MEKQSRHFVINDDEEEESDNPMPRYFQPGKIMTSLLEKKDENKTPDLSNAPKTSDSNSAPNKTSDLNSATVEKSNEEASPEKDETEVNKNTNTKNATSSGMTSKFGNEFSHLKSSKFYDETCKNYEKVQETSSKMSGGLLVNPRQRGNPLLKHIRNVPWEYSEMEPDYVMGRTSCALFLSMRYHNLFPNYIHDRLKSLGKAYQLRVLLVQVDVIEPSQVLKDLSVIAILADCTLMVAWSPEEAGMYLETYKMFENKSADLIREKATDDAYSQMVECLTTVRSINKTDASILLSTFGTLEKIIQASAAELALCPGVGPLKAKRLYEALRRPLKNAQKRVS